MCVFVSEKQSPKDEPCSAGDQAEGRVCHHDPRPLHGQGHIGSGQAEGGLGGYSERGPPSWLMTYRSNSFGCCIQFN